MIVFGWFLSVAAFVAGGFSVLGISGKYNLKKQSGSYVVERGNAVQTVSAMSGEKALWQEEGDNYEECSYRYNEDILTFLLMGINREEKADALFLFVLNPHEEAAKLIPINCNTMTIIDVYDGQGVYEDAMMSQIGTQYEFGINGKESCEYQVQAVRNLFYGIPISGYLAVEMDALPKVIELIDEIDLENIKDQTGSVELSADGGLERQSRYLSALIGQGKQIVRKDITVLARLYNAMSGNMVTNITIDEAAYLAVTTGGYHFDAGQVVTIMGKSINDEFYADEEALYKLILDVFYEPVD